MALVSGLQIAVELPDDVLIQILANLPVKTLIQLRCVSKSWCALIKSPAFINSHLKFYRKEIMLLKREGGGGRDKGYVFSFLDPDSLDLEFSPNFLFPFPENMRTTYHNVFFKLFGPCNGIVCMVYHDKVFLCNPALREFKSCPPCLFDWPKGYVHYSEEYGFGFDSGSNVYKLLCLYKIDSLHNIKSRAHSPRLKAGLYDSRTNSWKPIDTSVVPNRSFRFGSGCLFNGVFHWATFPNYGCTNTCIVDPDLDAEICEKFGRQSVGTILHFNMRTEVLGEFDYPDWLDGKSSTLTILNECLAVVRAGDEYKTKHIDIWMMKEYGVLESWTKQYVIGPYLVKHPFFCWRDGCLVVERKPGQLASYAFHTNETKKCQFSSYRYYFSGMLYKESLISVNELAIVPQGPQK